MEPQGTRKSVLPARRPMAASGPRHRSAPVSAQAAHATAEQRTNPERVRCDDMAGSSRCVWKHNVAFGSSTRCRTNLTSIVGAAAQLSIHLGARGLHNFFVFGQFA